MGKGQTKNSSKTFNNTGPSAQQQVGGQAQLDASLPILKTLSQQIMAALTGQPTQIPLVQNAVGAAKNANATSNQNATEGASRAGITGPFLQALLQTFKQHGAFNVSQVAPSWMQAFLNLAPGLSTLQGSPMFQAVGSGGGNASGSGTGSVDIGGILQGGAAVGKAFPDLFSSNTTTTTPSTANTGTTP